MTAPKSSHPICHSEMDIDICKDVKMEEELEFHGMAPELIMVLSISYRVDHIGDEEESIRKEFEAQAQRVNRKRCHGEKKKNHGLPHHQSSKILTFPTHQRTRTGGPNQTGSDMTCNGPIWAHQVKQAILCQPSS
uniref:Uncharacterized protein n=1 Tax=Oryza nivara TaxID=4536 RepID=A0A0E0FFX7_ORYNI